MTIFPKFSLHPPYFQNFWSSSYVDGLKIVCQKNSRGDHLPLTHHLEKITSLPVNIEIARLQSVSDRVMEVDITSHGVWKSLSLLFQCTDAGLIAILFASPLGEGDSNLLGAKIPDLL